MSVIATMVVPAEDFVLGAALTADSGIRITLERVVPVDAAFVPYFWTSVESLEEVEDALADDADVRSFRVVDVVGDRALVRVEWAEDVDGLLTAMVETGGTVLEALGEDGEWTLQIRFVDHEDLTAFYRRCAEIGVDVELQSVHNPGIPSMGFEVSVTPVQLETLRLALERGYFEVPRRTNLTELAGEIGISDTAASQRLRRGISVLLEAALPESEEETDDD